VPLDRPTTVPELGEVNRNNVPRLVEPARNVPRRNAFRFIAECGRHIVTDVDVPREPLVATRSDETKSVNEQAGANGQIEESKTVAQVHRLLQELVFLRAWAMCHDAGLP
jgi:hypothetical protein